MARERTDIDVDDLVERYLFGVSVKQLAADFNTCRLTITRRLVAAGIKTRSSSDAQRLIWTKRGPEARSLHMQAPHSARRGQTDTVETKMRRARTCYQRSLRIGRQEAEIAEYLRENRLDIECQWPVDIYNLDIAITSCRVAVEIYGCQPTTLRLAKINERTEYLCRKGWAVLSVKSYIRFALAGLAEKIIALVERRSRSVPTRGEYGVVWGNGQRATGSSFDIDGVPRIPGA